MESFVILNTSKVINELKCLIMFSKCTTSAMSNTITKWIA